MFVLRLKSTCLSIVASCFLSASSLLLIVNHEKDLNKNTNICMEA